MLIFLTKTKHPPLDILKTFLHDHGNMTAPRRTIRMDEGGELSGSDAFKTVVATYGYLLETMAADAPFQNGLVERPNHTLGNMVCCLLYSSNLGPEYWSYALMHAVYLKNRLTHRVLNDTPYHVYTGTCPSAKYLKVFGCPIIAKNPGKHPHKLDTHTSTGHFLGYTATDRNVYYINSVSKRIKITTHCVFDEAGMTLPPLHRSPANIDLIDTGYSNLEPGYDELQDPLPVDTDEERRVLDSQEVSASIRTLHMASPDGSTMTPTVTPLTVPITPTHDHPPSPSVPDLPFDLCLSSDPFNYTIQIDIPIKGDHATLGMKLIPCPYHHRLQLIDMLPGTPGARRPKWRSTLCHAYLFILT
jgi:hypothetical protein